MESDVGGPGVLTEEECLVLLAANQLGRVGVVVDGQPLVFPVNYVLDGHTIVFRTGVGTILGGSAFAMVASTGDIYYGLWYPIIIALMTFVVGIFFVPETFKRYIFKD